jgi:hypothetical protein
MNPEVEQRETLKGFSALRDKILNPFRSDGNTGEAREQVRTSQHPASRSQILTERIAFTCVDRPVDDHNTAACPGLTVAKVNYLKRDSFLEEKLFPGVRMHKETDANIHTNLSRR